jgi:uncharacterized membrane protein
MLRTHELHPSLVHLPLVLLPAAALVDLAAALRPRDRRLDRTGATLWRLTAAGGAIAGVTGLAASQEIALESRRARDMLFLHGLGNVVIVLVAAGLALRRARRRADLTSATAGLVAAAAATYTAYLGGELVYTYGAGVVAMGGPAAAAPPLFSRSGPSRLAVDAARGLGWIASRAWRAVTSRERVDRRALGAVAEVGTGASPAAGGEGAQGASV